MAVFSLSPGLTMAKSNTANIEKYFEQLSVAPIKHSSQKYRMTAIYTNRDLYGNFTGKTKITGDYQRVLPSEEVKWNNVKIANSYDYSAPFPEGTVQNYMENMTYTPSDKMLEAETFKDFPADANAVFARNLIWDLMAIEGFAWNHSDSLKLNQIYSLSNMDGEFEMADIGNYKHAAVQLNWTGISAIDGELFDIIEYRAIDNIVELTMENIKTKGTEQYWGTIWISVKTREIERAEMYSGSMQEIDITGFENKMLVKTIRELWIEKI